MVGSLTFINFQENYQTAEIYFYSEHVTPLSKTISNNYYCFIGGTLKQVKQNS